MARLPRLDRSTSIAAALELRAAAAVETAEKRCEFAVLHSSTGATDDIATINEGTSRPRTGAHACELEVAPDTSARRPGGPRTVSERCKEIDRNQHSDRARCARCERAVAIAETVVEGA